MRDIKTIRKLQKTINDALATAELLAKSGTTICEQNKWYSTWLGLQNASEAMVGVVKNTESAIASEAAEKKRIEEVEEYWRQSDEKLRAKEASV